MGKKNPFYNKPETILIEVLHAVTDLNALIRSCVGNDANVMGILNEAHNRSDALRHKISRLRRAIKLQQEEKAHSASS